MEMKCTYYESWNDEGDCWRYECIKWCEGRYAFIYLNQILVHRMSLDPNIRQFTCDIVAVHGIIETSQKQSM